MQVTQLRRDVSSGTALQEVSFWVMMEHTLTRAQAQRDSPEVILTLDILKAGKRFQPKVSFDSDTGMYSTCTQVCTLRVHRYVLYVYTELYVYTGDVCMHVCACL